jgi:hypothetical protein
VFAVLDSSDVCGEAKREYSAMGLQFEEFRSEDAPALEQPKGAGMIGTLMRRLKDINTVAQCEVPPALQGIGTLSQQDSGDAFCRHNHRHPVLWRAGIA